MKIRKEEIDYLQKRRRDNVGEIFEWNGKILRGIYPEKSAMVKEFFECGFLPELIKENLFPESWITDMQSDDFGVIIEHKRIWPIIYPQEWSFSMLRDSALAVLRVAKIARKYGYNMKDCHGLNILMENNQPKFVDLGSFHKNKNGSTGWEAYQEFLRFYYYPLYTWKDGLEYISKLSIFSANLMPHSEHCIYKYRFLRFLPSGILKRIIKLRFLLSNLASMDSRSLNEKLRNKNPLFRNAVLTVKFLINRLKFTISQDLSKLEKMIKKIKRKNTDSGWKHYHANISQKKLRFDKIIKHINACCPDARTAIDIGGNQGLFSLKILEQTGIEKVICQDSDEQTIDIGFNAHRDGKEKISYANYNCIAPIITTTRPFPCERFKADIVFSLALIHHLVLSQGFSLDDILGEFARYARKYACIEFMQKGLWIHGAKVDVPSWYTLEWFRGGFEKYFNILIEEQIEENYIVFFGIKKERVKNG